MTAKGCVDHVGLNRYIFIDKTRRAIAIGRDAPNLCCSQQNKLGSLLSEEGSDRRLIREI